jgi:hypothetical protein
LLPPFVGFDAGLLLLLMLNVCLMSEKCDTMTTTAAVNHKQARRQQG